MSSARDKIKAANRANVSKVAVESNNFIDSILEPKVEEKSGVEESTTKEVIQEPVPEVQSEPIEEHVDEHIDEHISKYQFDITPIKRKPRTRNFSVRLLPETYDKLEALAIANDVSVNAALNQILTQVLQ